MLINIGIDFKYLEICLELHAFGIFLDRLEQGLKHLTDQEILRISSSICKLNDLTDIQIAENELMQLRDRIMPRFFRNPALVSLWAIYESSVNLIADHLCEKLNERLPKLTKFGKKERMSFLDRADKYFRDFFELPLYADGHLESLERLMVLRHAIAHCNGRLEEVKSIKKERIEDWIKEEIGISSDQGDLLISEQFLRETYRAVKDSLSSLIRNVNSTYKAIG